MAAFLAAVGARVVNHGKVATPVDFAKIHVFVPAAVFKVGYGDLEELALMVNATTQSSSTKVQRMAKTLYKKSTMAAEELRSKDQRLIDLLFQNSTAVGEDLARIKRALPVLAVPVAAFGGVGLGIAALSFAAANRATISNMQSELEMANERIDKMITTVEANNRKLNLDMKIINSTVAELATTIDNGRMEQLLTTLYTRLRVYHGKALNRQADYERSIYAAFSGHLSPDLVPLETLRRRLATVATYGKRKGLKVVPMQLIESAFSMPVSVMTNTTGLSIIIEVPMIPEELESLDLLEVSHSPVRLDNRTTINLDFENGLILADPQRRFHREVRAEELTLCPTFKNFRFCSFNLLYREPRSCVAAYALQDKAKIASLCSRTFHRSDFSISDYGEDSILVNTVSDEVLRKECPHDSALQGVYRTHGKEVTLKLEPGCFLEASSMTYFGRGQAVETTEIIEPEIPVESLLDGISVDDAAAAVHAIAAMKNLTSLTVPISDVSDYLGSRDDKSQRQTDRGVGIGLAGAALGLALVVALGLMYRILVVRWRLSRAGRAQEDMALGSKKTGCEE